MLIQKHFYIEISIAHVNVEFVYSVYTVCTNLVQCIIQLITGRCISYQSHHTAWCVMGDSIDVRSSQQSSSDSVIVLDNSIELSNNDQHDNTDINNNTHQTDNDTDIIDSTIANDNVNSDIISHTGTMMPIQITLNQSIPCDQPYNAHTLNNNQINTFHKQLHILPCHISYSGDANISTYFTPTIQPFSSHTATQPQYTADLRGRQLTSNMPINLNNNNCVGIICNDDVKQNNKIISNHAMDDSPHSKRSKHHHHTAAAAANHNHTTQHRSTIEWSVDTTFNDVWLWNRDEQIHESDYLQRALTQLIPLNNAIHAPIPIPK